MWTKFQQNVVVGVVLFIGVVAAVVSDSESGMSDDYPMSLADLFAGQAEKMPRDRRDPRTSGTASGSKMLGGKTSEGGDGDWTPLGLGKRDPGSFTPYVSVGVLSNMQQFFDNLKTNLEGLETLPAEERDALLGKAMVMAEQEKVFRPRATAAYLHALRNHRPSHKLRNFVEDSEATNGNMRGANNYDPNLLWSGLGKRR